MLSSRPLHSLVTPDHSLTLWEGFINFRCYLEFVTPLGREDRVQRSQYGETDLVVFDRAHIIRYLRQWYNVVQHSSNPTSASPGLCDLEKASKPE